MTRPVGRPTDYSDELADRICAEIMSGKSLSAVCLMDEMPGRAAANLWLAKYEYFMKKYVEACKVRQDFRFEELHAIADTEPDVSRAKLKIDVIKWQLSKEAPKKYGDKAGDEASKQPVIIHINGKELGL